MKYPVSMQHDLLIDPLLYGDFEAHSPTAALFIAASEFALHRVKTADEVARTTPTEVTVAQSPSGDVVTVNIWIGKRSRREVRFTISEPGK